MAKRAKRAKRAASAAANATNKQRGATNKQRGTQRGVQRGTKADFTSSVITVGKQKPAFENAVLVIGLPGIGLVSKMAVDHLARATRARRFATLYSPHFPNQVLALKSGKLRAFSMRFYEKKLAGKSKRCAVFLRGDLQPLTVEGQYEVAAKILGFARSLGVTRVVAMAGYAVQKSGGASGAGGAGGAAAPAVYCAATSEAFFNEFKRFGAKPAAGVVPIVGMAGLVPALARVYGLDGACLLVETPGTTIDPHGAKTLVAFLGKWLGQKFDSRDLEKRAKYAEKMLRKLEEQAQPAAQQAKAGAPAAPEPIKREALTYIR